MTEEVERLNKLPVNQYIKILLKKAGVKPNPDLLYLLQLVEWGLENEVVSVNEQNTLKTGWESPLTNWRKMARLDFLELVRRLMYENHQERIMDLLLKNGPTAWPEEEPWVSPLMLAKMKDPEDAAQYLAENLQAALSADEPPDSLRD